MEPERKQILLTNDDGIESPGLWAAAEALSSLGFVTVAAPRQQFSGAGRSHPIHSDGTISPRPLQIGHQIWTAYAVGGSPAQAVVFAVLDLLPRKPDLIVSGINYGENIGSSITSSGTVGAALEGAAFDIPAMAVSLQITDGNYLGYSTEVTFETAAYFTQLFARRVLEEGLPPDVHVLKIDVPAGATPQTPWRTVRQAMQPYYVPRTTRSGSLEGPGLIGYDVVYGPGISQPGTDAHALAVDRVVSVAPLSLDMTSRIQLEQLDSFLRNE
ncbi:MAG: 5'/3'-nucleotidase SurE [Bellilinea sp.]